MLLEIGLFKKKKTKKKKSKKINIALLKSGQYPNSYFYNTLVMMETLFVGVFECTIVNLARYRQFTNAA